MIWAQIVFYVLLSGIAFFYTNTLADKSLHIRLNSALIVILTVILLVSAGLQGRIDREHLITNFILPSTILFLVLVIESMVISIRLCKIRSIGVNIFRFLPVYFVSFAIIGGFTMLLISGLYPGS